MLGKLKHPLKQLNKSKYADIYAQQAKVRADLAQIHSLLHNDPFNTELNQQKRQIICWEVGFNKHSLIWDVQFWAKVFILPQEVINQVTKIYKNFLWAESENYNRTPYVAWDIVCTPKKQGGLGVKNLNLWNIACVAKLVWTIAMKKDSFWVKWVHGRYIRGGDWWNYTPKSDTS